MAQLSQGLGLDLADTLAGHVELLAHFLQRPGAAILNTETQLQHLFLTGSQSGQHIHQLLLQQGEGRGLAGLTGALVGNEVAQVGILLLADGGFQRHRLLSNLQDLPDLVHRHIHLLGDLVGAGIVAQLLQKLTGDTDDLVDGLHHVNGDPDGTGLIRDGAGDGLPDPPGCVGGELVALGIIELFNGLDEAQIALLDQVQEQHTAAHIPLGNGNHQTEVRLCQLLLGAFTLLKGLAKLSLFLRSDGGCFTGLTLLLQLVQTGLGLRACGHGLCQHDLFIGVQQGDLTDLLEVHTDRIVDGEVADQRVGVHQLFFLHVGDLLGGRLIVGQLGEEVLLRADVDVQRFQRIVKLIHLIAFQIQIVHGFHQLAGVQLALLLAAGQQLPQLFLPHQPAGGGEGSDLLIVQTDDAGLFGLFIRHDMVCFRTGGLCGLTGTAALSRHRDFIRNIHAVGSGQQSVGLRLQTIRAQITFRHVAFLSFCS